MQTTNNEKHQQENTNKQNTSRTKGKQIKKSNSNKIKKKMFTENCMTNRAAVYSLAKEIRSWISNRSNCKRQIRHGVLKVNKNTTQRNSDEILSKNTIDT